LGLADARACSQPPRHRCCRFSGTTVACAAGRGAAAGLTDAQMNLQCLWRHNRTGLQRPKRARKRTHGCSAKGRGERARARETQARHTPMLTPRPERGRAPGRPRCSGWGAQTRAWATRQTSRTPRVAAAVETSEGVGAAATRGRSSAGWECWHRNRLQGARGAMALGAACSASSRWQTLWPRPWAAASASTSASNSIALGSNPWVLVQTCRAWTSWGREEAVWVQRNC
jgi:hypothetical protein